MSAILIGGTPGTGKTIVAKALGARLGVEVFSLGEMADSAGCVTDEDKARDTGIIDEDCLVEAIIDVVEDEKGKRILIEGHYIDLVPNPSVEWVFLLRTHPDELKTRLEKRGYAESKVLENVEAEVLGVCQLDALDSFGEKKVFEIDTTNLTSAQTVDMIESIMRDPGDPIRIDWMESLEKEGRLDEFLSD
ncbi:MAG: nucleotide kinase [Candidatus Thorarchaeota archaeon]|nr:MAG: nucleotide kinase [Candidatus Thorarchaeota archaeon]RLI58986.1 MAG: nucleotide kinase [Candidatus Thorarchaeota archaeon]